MCFNVLHDGSPHGILFFPELIALLQCFLLFIQVLLREQSQGIQDVCFAAHIGKDAVITHLKKTFGQQVEQKPADKLVDLQKAFGCSPPILWRRVGLLRR